MNKKKVIVLFCTAAMALPMFAGHRHHGHHRDGLFLAGGILHTVGATLGLIDRAVNGPDTVVVNPAPVVTTPVVSTPVVSAPVVPTPVVSTPVVTTPVVTTPVVTAPVVETYSTGYYPYGYGATVVAPRPIYYGPRHYHRPPPPAFRGGYRGGFRGRHRR